MPRATPDHLAAVDAIYQAAIAPERWSDTLTMLADHVGATGSFLIYQPAHWEAGFLVTGRLRDDLIGLYFEQYAKNPYSEAFARAKRNQIYRANQLVDFSAIRRSAFFADILAPQTMMEQLVLPHASLTRNGSSGGVSFALTGRQAEEAERAAARFARLAPHLTRAIDLTLQFGRHQSGTWQLEHILDQMPSAAVLIDKRGTIIRTNAMADTLLREADGIGADGADGLRLAAHSRSEARLLAQRIAEALAVVQGDDRGLDGSLRITRPSGRPPLLVLVTPLPPAAFSLWETVDGGARALVQIVDIRRPSGAQAEILRVTAGLTDAEARVAALIGGGMTAAEAAATLGVSLNTVKTHLTRCFDKTGVRSQVALARLVASIPVPGSRRGPDEPLF